MLSIRYDKIDKLWSFAAAARPESLETIFKKRQFWVKKRHYIFGKSISGQIRKYCSRAFEGLSYLAYTILKNNLCYLVIFFIHIIQMTLFSREYLPIAGNKVNNHY